MKRHGGLVAAFRSLRHTASRVLAGAIACACVTGSAAAQDLASEPIATATLQAPLDTAVGLRTDGPIGKIVVSQPETVQVRRAGNELYVIGSEPGATNLLVYDRQGQLSQSLDVQVGYDAHALRELLADALPGEAITVKALSSSLLLEGEVSSPSVLAIAETLAEKIAPDAVISRLHARSSQVLLEVRIMEVSSRGLTDISSAVSLTTGSALTATAGGGSVGVDTPFGVMQLHGSSGRFRIDAAVRALEDRGELRVMAQPSLVALSGETASFRAGGEFPFPAPQDDNTISIQFRPYGAGMTFKPVVQENGLIRIALDAELSEIDPSVGLRVAGLSVPGLKMRRATTTVDLHDGEAFLIAGLFEDSSERFARDLPFLSRIPILERVLAPVFRAVRKTERHTELAILVTPHIGTQVSSPLGEKTMLAEAEPAPAPVVEPPRTPKSASAPRGPPLRVLVAEVRDVLRPPVRWMKQAASRFTTALLGRA